MCVHNRDSKDFTNAVKFQQFILKQTNDFRQMSWDLLDETGSHVVVQIIEDEDQGPSKDRGPYRLHCHPTKD